MQKASSHAAGVREASCEDRVQIMSLDVESWISSSKTGGYHRRQVSALTVHDAARKKTSRSCWKINWWSLFAHSVTWWAPSLILKCFGMREQEVRQAWREKVALCLIIVLICAAAGFLTFGLGPILCPKNAYNARIKANDLQKTDLSNFTMAYGNLYDATETALALNVSGDAIRGRDITTDLSTLTSTDCDKVLKALLPEDCATRGTCWDTNALLELKPRKTIAYEWEDVSKDLNAVVYDGKVLRLPEWLQDHLKFDEVAEILIGRNGNEEYDVSLGITRLGWKGRATMRCLLQNYSIGKLSQQTVGCFAFFIMQIISLIIIGLLVLTRFVLAVSFSWFLSHQLDKMKKSKNKSLEESVDNECPSILSSSASRILPSRMSNVFPAVLSDTLKKLYGVEQLSDYAENNYDANESNCTDPYVLLLVTCYSEGQASLKMTLDSLAQTDYHDQRKLILIIADGMILGERNLLPTPEIARRMLKLESSMEAPEPKSYLAIAEESKSHNMARVYAGHYVSRGRAVPCVLIAKCGTPEEAQFPKPGNRGKRDSQLILMNFMQRVLFNDRMAPLDFDLFNKICWLMGITPDLFEIALMVDADTKVAIDSLGRMVNAMRRDPTVMGLCGETRIANKRSSWVSAIQVFEYYISHHLGKAFESVFGGVTCLPGCFCMYRLKSVKEGRIVPILTSPSIIEKYSRSSVNTLHAKNLLLLGEDRFLTTLMLKAFPHRKMIFVPQAYCKTFVPDEFRVLLSQRRRWINSTIHNLLELALVPDLCGIFCFSMQFVIVMELIGTVILPAAIFFTFVLIGTAFINPFQAIIPLALLTMVLGLPAILILVTTRKIVYIWWMFAYLLALPVWNFILPVYAYWHFDDFSWGETRKIQGNSPIHGGAKHKKGDPAGDFSVPMKTWLAWSRSLDHSLQLQDLL